MESICDRAAARGVPTVAENLDFRRKKAWLWRYGKRFGSILSNFRSRQVMAALEQQCRRRGVELIALDPAWTRSFRLTLKGRRRRKTRWAGEGAFRGQENRIQGLGGLVTR